ncbi:hypothetical protein ES332_D13G072700v1 [Gossypium tomentosum]|uniref:Uncharacterized protein n=1 Tax=Gossypium tomentosum TaxID=34277 RepID=A0A5D2HU73_GOSTO|nr:hypothetical protein ES332_D13G072700v1 [Gossypium tomentosum]
MKLGSIVCTHCYQHPAKNPALIELVKLLLFWLACIYRILCYVKLSWRIISYFEMFC